MSAPLRRSTFLEPPAPPAVAPATRRRLAGLGMFWAAFAGSIVANLAYALVYVLAVSS